MREQRRRLLGAGGAILFAAGPLGSLAGCASKLGDGGWTTLVDGTRIPEGWKPLGEGNWRIAEGSLEGVNGKGGFLVSPQSYSDFELRAEFWGRADTNSGIFIRCQDPAKVAATSSYEVNIWDSRPDPIYGSGAIVDFGRVTRPYPKIADRWNSMEVVARGSRLTVTLNGQQTVDIVNDKFRSGPIALQSAGGTIRFRRVQIRLV